MPYAVLSDGGFGSRIVHLAALPQVCGLEYLHFQGVVHQDLKVGPLTAAKLLPRALPYLSLERTDRKYPSIGGPSDLMRPNPTLLDPDCPNPFRSDPTRSDPIPSQSLPPAPSPISNPI